MEHQLKPTGHEEYSVHLPRDKVADVVIGVPDFMVSLLAIAVCITVGGLMNDGLADLGMSLPQFVMALFAGVLIGNLGLLCAPKVKWPMHAPAGPYCQPYVKPVSGSGHDVVGVVDTG